MASVIRRPEMAEASLSLGGTPIALVDYETTGLMAVAVGPRGCGKTNAGLVMAEQLSEQGWVSVLIDPENELESMYGAAVADAEELATRLELRDQPIVVVRAADATEFVPYGRVLMESADRWRKPVFVVIDEGQLFSVSKGGKRGEDISEAVSILNDFGERGRKRALDFFVTATRFTGTLHRSVFANKNLTLVGCQEDPTVWPALSAQFKASKIDFADLQSLAPSQFFCISRRGIEKVKMPMAEALRKVAPKAKAARKKLPSTFGEWDRAMRELPKESLLALTPDVVSLLASVSGLSPAQIQEGNAALEDELSVR